MTETKKTSFLDEIVSIEDCGEMQTYDFTVPSTHCFFANGVLVHNSGEIEEGADCLIQLRWVGRDNFFADPENPTVDKREYQVNILKQRNGPIDGVTLDFDVAYYRFSDRFGGLNG